MISFSSLQRCQVSQKQFYEDASWRIDDYAKDGGEELFTKMHCVRITNP